MASTSKSNRNDRKRKSISSPSPSTWKPKPKSPKEAQEDAIAILNAVIEFRSSHGGSIPNRSTMEPLFLSVKPHLHEHFASAAHLYTRFRSLRERFRRAERSGVGPTPFDRTFFDLSAKAWGAASNSKAEEEKPHPPPPPPPPPPAAAAAAAAATATAEEDKVEPKTAEEVEEEDASGCASIKLATEQVRKFWEQQGLSAVVLEMGLEFVERGKWAALEKRWRAHYKEGLKNEAQLEEVRRYVVNALLDGLKGKGKSVAAV